MKTITCEITNEIIINKSRFITVISPISDIEAVDKKLEEIKNQYKDAAHYCYAYIIKSNEKCKDDGEPSGTAGMPILNVLKKNNLTNILCIVIRYFGGIKLGAGGLVRAYSTSAKEAINKAQFGILTKGYQITIEFDYNNTKDIDYILKNIDTKKTYKEKIQYTFDITTQDFKTIEISLLEHANIIKKEEKDIIKGEN